MDGCLNAGRKCKAKTNLVSACGQNLGEYAAELPYYEPLIILDVPDYYRQVLVGVFAWVFLRISVRLNGIEKADVSVSNTRQVQ